MTRGNIFPGKKHKKMVARKEALQEMGVRDMRANNTMTDGKDGEEDTRRYCEACEVMVHNNYSWLLHIAGEIKKENLFFPCTNSFARKCLRTFTVFTRSFMPRHNITTIK